MLGKEGFFHNYYHIIIVFDRQTTTDLAVLLFDLAVVYLWRKSTLSKGHLLSVVRRRHSFITKIGMNH